MTTQQVQLERRSPAYWRVTFNNPPVNIWGPEATRQMLAVVESIESDPDVKVVVFDSAVEGFFIVHYDFLAKREDSLALLWVQLACRLCPMRLRESAARPSFPSPRFVGVAPG